MADRLIKILADNKYSTQGASRVVGATFKANQSRADAIVYRFDFRRWLNGATIASADVTSSGATVDETDASTYVDLEVSGLATTAEITIDVVTSDGRSKELKLLLAETTAAQPDGRVDTDLGDLAYLDRLPISLIDTITISEDGPSGGSDGDIWFKVAV